MFTQRNSPHLCLSLHVPPGPVFFGVSHAEEQLAASRPRPRAPELRGRGAVGAVGQEQQRVLKVDLRLAEEQAETQLRANSFRLGGCRFPLFLVGTQMDFVFLFFLVAGG